MPPLTDEEIVSQISDRVYLPPIPNPSPSVAISFLRTVEKVPDMRRSSSNRKSAKYEAYLRYLRCVGMRFGNGSPLGDRLCCLPRRFLPTYGKYFLLQSLKRLSHKPRGSERGWQAYSSAASHVKSVTGEAKSL